MTLQADCGGSDKAAIVKEIAKLRSELMELKSMLKTKG